MWWTNSDTLRTNTQIIHQELKSSHQMEKSSCCPGSWKNDKQLKENYCPISLLLICGKMLEQLLYDKMLELFADDKPIPSNQSGFKPVGSCIIQLLLDVFLTIFINLLMTASRQELSFLTNQKHLIKFDTRVYFRNWSKVKYQVIFITLTQIF